MVRLAFYIGPGSWADQIIRWATRSDVSHVEILITGPEIVAGVGYVATVLGARLDACKQIAYINIVADGSLSGASPVRGRRDQMAPKKTYTGEQVAAMIAENLSAAIEAAIKAAADFRAATPKEIAEMGDWGRYYNVEADLKIAIKRAAYRATWDAPKPDNVECDGFVDYL